MKTKIFLLLLLTTNFAFAQQTPFEKSGKKETTTYESAIAFYQNLAKTYPQQSKLLSYGLTDFGQPLHLMVLSKSKIFFRSP